jgi:putative Holliday junction resolvase
MAMDIGDRRIGVALSDPTQTLASPLKTIVRLDDESAVLEITSLISQYDIRRLVVGLPYLADGSVGEQARKVLDFTGKIKAQAGVETVMLDERFTSVAAGQMLREAGKKRDGLKKHIDAAAATVILQAHLDEAAAGGQISQEEPPSL